MKYFTGIGVSDEFQKLFLEFKKSNSELTGIKWTKPDNLHITTLYVGEVLDEFLPKNISRINNFMQQMKGFILEFDKVDFSPNGNMIWLYIKPSKEFEDFVKGLAKELKIPLRKSIVPHMTIARLKKDRKYYKINGVETFLGSCQKVGEIFMFKSSLNSKSSNYTLEQKFSFS